ncbi:MAG: replicative DNA helicase [Oscillospiraceae bacterium]
MADFDLSGINIPYNLDAEQSVLGICLMNSDAVQELTATLKPEHFHIKLNRELYAVMVQMALSAQKIDIVTVLDAAMRQNIFETSEQAKDYLARLVNAPPSVSALGKYADIITERYLVRSLIYASKEIIDAANESGGDDPEKLLDFAEQKIFDIRKGVEVRGLTPIAGIINDKLNELDELSKRYEASGGKLAVTGLPTTFHELDSKIYGLNKSDLIILAARPGMGKTSFALNIATNVAKRNLDKAIAIFSLEMSKDQLVSRMLSSEASLDSEAMKTGNIPDGKWPDIGRAADVLMHLNILLDDTSNINIAEIKSKLRRVPNLGLVVIDYLQLMTSTKNYNGNRVLEISEITRNLKIMAKELNVPVITLSQLARGTEARTDKRPMLSDLRESGSIEQDADIVLFLYRNSYYDKTDPNVNSCECIIAKNRHGEVGTIGLGWDGKFTRFTNAETIHQER